MSFDKATRNALARTVGACRALLTEDARNQLQQVYGFQPDGTVLPMDRLSHLDDQGRETAAALRQWLGHLTAVEIGTEAKRRAAAFERMAHETAFTVLNRLAALRMCEERGLVIECVRRGMESDGFAMFERLTGGALGARGQAYRTFLEHLFDELAVDLGPLFDRRAPHSLVFPGDQCLERAIVNLNEKELAYLWKEDETIGWVYQYFNDPAARKKMREESGAPRNSRELAVRNQFFTPRYVVQFLTDNTLGRIWYEMTKGETRLKEQCQYLVRKPNEVFLGPGQNSPPAPSNQMDLPQEELLKQPVYIPHRVMKDPRTIHMLDPACGSMHFGIYAFDLFLVIYEEAWELEERKGLGALVHEVGLQPLRQCYDSREAFLRDVPRLIVEHNLHGIDIDPRATQIAALALWMRAQRAWQTQGIGAVDRPRLRRTNIVCAEPMPGEADLLREFIGKLQPRLLGQLVDAIVEKMKLAGEAGSLLRIEEEIKDVVATAKRQWQAGPKAEQLLLFPEHKRPKAEQLSIFDVAGITDETFWETAESQILEALHRYAEQAENGVGYQRRLFAEDAARGFAFIDLCRKRYDVVLMNPPFGESVEASKSYIEEHYEHSSADIFQAFVERGLHWLALHGREGVISARTGFFLGDSKDWRAHVVFRNRVVCFADLGLGVLDDALVEVATYVVEQGDPKENWVFTNRQLDTREKGEQLLMAVEATVRGEPHGFGVFDQSLLELIPDLTFAYWAPASLLRRYSTVSRFGTTIGRVRQGVATADDFRFARLGWEVGSWAIGPGKRWQRFSKGGEYSPPYDDIHLLVDWGHNGAQLKAFPGCFIRNETLYFTPGATYTVRTASAFAGKVLPAGCIFSHNAQSWFPESTAVALLSISYLSCRVPQTFLELSVGSGDIATAGSAARRYTTAVVESVPSAPIAAIDNPDNLKAVDRLYRYRLGEFMGDETSCHFVSFHIKPGCFSLKQAANDQNQLFLKSAVDALRVSASLDEAVNNAFGLTPEERSFVDCEVGLHPVAYSGRADVGEAVRLFHLRDEHLMAEAVARHGPKRWFTKKAYFVDRRLEIICHHLQVAPATVEELLREQQLVVGLGDLVRNCISEALGCVFGRWDIRSATGENPAPDLPEPFAPLPVCPPGMLQNERGLPITQDDVSRLQAADQWHYPLDIPWGGILADDPGDPPDIEARVRQVLEVIWKDRAEAIEHEACEILDVPTLRDYFRKPAGFFADHLKRYSKSRRQAPIYWPLSTASGSYTLWIYYHRLNEDLLYRAVNEFVNPKISETIQEIAEIENQLGAASGRQATALRGKLEEARGLRVELEEFKAELLRVAGLPYKPDLNDGVLITASPLWKLFRLPKWRKDLEACWKELEAGEYNWAHLAYAIWPDRVREVCKRDRSIAIAHGLEDLYEGEARSPGKRSRRTRKP